MFWLWTHFFLGQFMPKRHFDVLHKTVTNIWSASFLSSRNFSCPESKSLNTKFVNYRLLSMIWTHILYNFCFDSFGSKHRTRTNLQLIAVASKSFFGIFLCVFFIFGGYYLQLLIVCAQLMPIQINNINEWTLGLGTQPKHDEDQQILASTQFIRLPFYYDLIMRFV